MGKIRIGICICLLTRRIRNQGYRKNFETQFLSGQQVMYFIDPAYTSQAGKLLFMQQMGGAVHEAASYAIGLKGMNLYQILLPAWLITMAPPMMLAGIKGNSYTDDDFRTVWKEISDTIRGIKTHMFYKNRTRVLQYGTLFLKWLTGIKHRNVCQNSKNEHAVTRKPRFYPLKIYFARQCLITRFLNKYHVTVNQEIL